MKRMMFANWNVKNLKCLPVLRYSLLALVLLLLSNLNAQNQAVSTASVDSREDVKEMLEMPRFPGCEEDKSLSPADRQKCAESKLLEFIAKHIVYPQDAVKHGIEGTVVVQFVVGKNGVVKDEHVIRDIGGGCGQEAQRIVAHMREENIQWIPGKKDGEAVNVQYNLPVLFRFETRKDRKEKRNKKKSKH